ncbi:MAG: hypothetical protein ACREHD_28100 [Pirellulales bacterium]
MKLSIRADSVKPCGKYDGTDCRGGECDDGYGNAANVQLRKHWRASFS